VQLQAADLEALGGRVADNDGIVVPAAAEMFSTEIAASSINARGELRTLTPGGGGSMDDVQHNLATLAWVVWNERHGYRGAFKVRSSCALYIGAVHVDIWMRPCQSSWWCVGWRCCCWQDPVVARRKFRRRAAVGGCSSRRSVGRTDVSGVLVLAPFCRRFW
jgi:hypothetical protein